MKEKQTLVTAGLDVDTLLTMLSNLHQEVAEMNAQQEYLKRALKATTERLQILRNKLYHMASGNLDMMIAAVEKGSAPAKNFQRLRSRMERPESSADSTQADVSAVTVKPTPEKTA